jgi:hypothetical protein
MTRERKQAVADGAGFGRGTTGVHLRKQFLSQSDHGEIGGMWIVLSCLWG